MDNNNQEYTLKLRAKLAIGFLFLIVGIPMIYTSIIYFDKGDPFTGSIMVILFLLWSVVALKAISFKILLTDSKIEKRGLFTPNIIYFDTVNKIHFGSTFSNFYIENNDNTVYIGRDFEKYDHIINYAVERISSKKGWDNIQVSGDEEYISKYKTG